MNPDPANADTPSPWKQLRQSPAAAFVVPFAGFMALVPVSGWTLLFPKNHLLPWWRSTPELWIYPLQSIACLGLLWFWRKHYPLRPIRGWPVAIGAGLVGIAIWLTPVTLHAKFDLGGDDSWLHWLGFQERLDGFDPTLLDHQSNPLGSFLTLGFRLLRLVIVVPLIEEIFWRGFLMRWLIDTGNRWDRLPIGTFAWPSFLFTTVLFALVHQTSDWSAALIYGALAGWVTVRTRSLGAVVLMHAVANLVLGLYILKSGFWGLW